MKSTLVEELGLKEIDECPVQFHAFARAVEDTPYFQGTCFFRDPLGSHYILTTMTINLPSHGPFEGLDIRSKEEVLFCLPVHYPYKAPRVMLNRTDFPFSSLPHVNPSFSSGDRLIIPNTLCLHRGDIDEWFLNAAPERFFERVLAWLKDAAKGELIKNNDGFEPMLRLECKHLMLYDSSAVLQLMDANPKPIIMTYRNISNVISLKNDEEYAFKLEVSELYNHDGFPCLLLFNKEAEPNAKFLGHHNGSLGDFGELFDFTLIQRAIRYFNNHHLDIHNSLHRFLMIYGIKRPQNLIGSSFDIELVNCLIELPDYMGSYKITGKENCSLVEHHNPFDPIAAARLSNSQPLLNKTFALIGCGALGSKISLSLARMGVVHQTLIDYDEMAPHNLARHALFMHSNNGHRMPKAKALAGLVAYLYGTDTSRFLLKNILDVSYDELNTQDYVVDCTASGIVLDYLAATKTIAPRIIRAEIAHEGQLGLIFFEGPDRTPDLRDLRYILYYQAMHDDIIYRWLQHDKDNTNDFAHQEFPVGLGCSSDTMILDDAVISVHAGVATSIIKSLETIATGFIYVNEYYPNDLTQNSVKKYEVESFEIIICNDWTVKIRHSLLKRIHDLAKDVSENGGIFVGNIHARSKVVLILDIHIPDGNLRSPNGLVRGDVKNYMKHLEERTCGLINYVGEWHTHPRMASTKMSSIDGNAFTLLKEVLWKMQLPVIHGIFNEQKYNFYLFESD